MFEHAKQFLVRTVLGVPSTLFSLAVVGAIHEFGFHPEQTITGWIMTAPSVLATQLAFLVFLFLVSATVWGIADHIVYRRPARSKFSAHTAQPSGRKLLAPILASLLSGAALLGSLIWLYRVYTQSPQISGGSETQNHSVRNVAGPPIEWRFDKPVTVFLYSRSPGESVHTDAIQIHATNKTDLPLKQVSAFILPDMKDEKMKMRVNPHGVVLSPDQSATIIPPRADFDLLVSIPGRLPASGKQGLTATEFLAEYGGFKFEFNYDRVTFGQNFPLKYIEDQINFIEERTRDQARIAPTMLGEPVKPKPRYEAEEIGVMLGVLRKWSEIIDRKCDPASLILQVSTQSWEGRIKAQGPAPQSEKLKEARTLADTAWSEIRKILNDNQYYMAELEPIINDNAGANATIDDALRQLIESLDEMAKYPGINAVRYLDPTFNRVQAISTMYQRWIGTSRAAILAKTKELREWRNP
jgi:hypothetical protein